MNFNKVSPSTNRKANEKHHYLQKNKHVGTCKRAPYSLHTVTFRYACNAAVGGYQAMPILRRTETVPQVHPNAHTHFPA